MRISPSLGSYKPPIMLAIKDFPEPVGPTIPYVLYASNLKLRFCKKLLLFLLPRPKEIFLNYKVGNNSFWSLFVIVFISGWDKISLILPSATLERLKFTIVKEVKISPKTM